MASNIVLTSDTKYQLLLQISHKVRNTLDLDEILNQLLDILQSVLDYSAAGIFILNRESIFPQKQQSPALIAGIAQRGFDLHPEETDRMLMLGEGITGFVIRTGKEVIIPDVSKDDRYVVGRSTTRSEIAVPISQDEITIGALNVESDTLNFFGERDLEILRFLADAAAISIEKAMLHLNLLEKQHIDQQLKTATAIQARLIPTHPPEITGYEINGIYLPASEIGGDYFDYIPLDDDKLGFVIADVSGHGVPAALVMSAFKALLRSQAQTKNNPARTCRRTNRLLPDFTGYADFITAIYGILNPKNGLFTHTNCGHHPILRLRSDGSVDRYKIGGPALGIYDEHNFENCEIVIDIGDTLIFYTDGILENENPDGIPFGTKRLIHCIQSKQFISTKAMIEELVDAAKYFCKCDSFSDDVTLVIVKRTM